MVLSEFMKVGLIATSTNTPSRLLRHASPSSMFTIRQAKKEDIPSMNKCNLDNLPENYSHYFYINHLERWPELSLIAESSKKEMIGTVL